MTGLLNVPAGHAFIPCWRTQRRSPGTPGPLGTQTCLPQPPPFLSVPQPSSRAPNGSLLGKSEVDGMQVPGFTTAGGVVSWHESVRAAPSTGGLWHWPSWSIGVQSWPCTRLQVVDPDQQLIPGAEHEPPWSGPQEHAVHCAGPAGLMKSLVG